MKMKRLVSMYLLLILLFLPTQYNPKSSGFHPQDEEKSTLRLGILQEIKSLNPFTALEDMDYVAFTMIYDALMTIGEDVNYAPNLAESWESSDGGRTWTFHLVENATFHDGQKVTSEDVKFSFEYNLAIEVWVFDMYFNQNANGSNFVSVLSYDGGPSWTDGLVYNMTTPDDYTFTINFRKPVAFGDGLMITIMPKHIWKNIDPASGGTAYDPIKEGTLIGSGPFKFVEKTAEYVRLAANDNYHWGRPHVDEIYWVYYYSEETMVSALKKGEIDAIIYGLSPTSYVHLQEAKLPYIDFVRIPRITGFWSDVAFNMNEGGNSYTGEKRIGRDRNLRKALNYATDREFIVNEVYLGLADVGYGPIVPAVDYLGWYWEPKPEYFSGIGNPVEEYTYSPEKAIEWLEKTGLYGPYEDRDGDGIREDKNGRPLSFECLVRKEFPMDHTVFLYLKEWWKEIGVEITEELVDEKTMEYRTYYPPSGPRFDMAIWYWSQDIDPNYMLAVETTAQAGWWNECWYHNKTYDRYYNLQFSEMNRTQRQKYVWKCQEIWYDDSPRILYVYPDGLYAWRTDKIGGWGNLSLHLGRIPDHFWGMAPIYLDLKPVKKTITVDASAGQTIKKNLWYENVRDTAFVGKANVSGSFVRDWASPPTLDFETIDPGENKTLEFTVKIPDDAPSGSCILTWNLYADGKYMDTINFVFEIPAPPIWTQIWFWAAIIGIVAVATALILYRRRPGTKT